MNTAALCAYHRAVLASFVAKAPHLTAEEIEERALCIYWQCGECQGLARVGQGHLGHDLPCKGSEAHFENLRAAS